MTEIRRMMKAPHVIEFVAAVAMLQYFVPPPAANGQSGTPQAGIVREFTEGNRTVLDALACQQCSITARSVLTLGMPDESEALRQPANSVRADNGGRYWLLGAGAPLVFSSTGTYAGNVAGDSTSAWVFPSDVVALPHDSLLVIDAAGGHALVVDSALRTARAIRLSFAPTRVLVVRWPDRVIVSGSIATPESAGFPLHEVSFTGADVRLTRSFGSEDGSLYLGEATNMRQSLARAPGGGYWAAEVSRYRMTRRDTANAAVEVLEREAEWFAGTRVPTLGGLSRPPDPLVVGMEADDAGLLWMYVRVPRQTWDTAWPAGTRGLIEVPVTPEFIGRLYDTLVEVIDARTATVVARRVLREFVVISPLPGHRVAAYSRGATQSALGVIELSVVRSP